MPLASLSGRRRRGRVDALVEVKTRRGGEAVPAGRLVSPRQAARLARAAAAWAGRHPDRVVRVDLLVIRLGGLLPSVRRHADLALPGTAGALRC